MKVSLSRGELGTFHGLLTRVAARGRGARAAFSSMRNACKEVAEAAEARIGEVENVELVIDRFAYSHAMDALDATEIDPKTSDLLELFDAAFYLEAAEEKKTDATEPG